MALAPKDVPLELFGKEHWAVLGYVDACCAQERSTVCMLDKERMRCNANVHPTHANKLFIEWQPCYGTHLCGFYDMADIGNPIPAILNGTLLPDHDDWDCLHDLELAGLVKVLSDHAGKVRLTKEGARVVALIRSHKSHGGMYGNFKLVFVSKGRMNEKEDNAPKRVVKRAPRKASAKTGEK